MARISHKHGMHRSPEYNSWANMIARCRDVNRADFHRYGGRGIKVCDRWRSSFSNFYEDMGKRPSGSHTIDRIDPNGDYEPSNCRWADKWTQALNRQPALPNRLGFRGVAMRKSGRCESSIVHLGKRYHIASCQTLEEAAWMYDQWAIALRDKEASLNFAYE